MASTDIMKIMRRASIIAVASSQIALALIALCACQSERTRMVPTNPNEFATNYTSAWCSQSAASVAAFFSPAGSLKINDGSPAIGRTAIARSVQSFMTAFPDLVVHMDKLTIDGANIEYHWTLTGSNTGPGGTGRPVLISGYEDWRFGAEGLIAESKGHFDAAEYERQLKAGFTSPQ
jgi:hypothetical protein